MSETKPPDIVVLGGGSAGWITACLLHHAWGARGAKVTVVESPNIGIIGVGEGSTPQLKAFFDHLGIAEQDWMPACDATYKLGIRFTGWSRRPGFESYFHPFPGPTDLHSEPTFIRNCEHARRGADMPAHPDRYFLASVLAAAGKGPCAPDNFPFAPSYGYHFDAYKLGEYLRGWATARGAVHRAAEVEEIELGPDGDVSALRCANGEQIAGDIFIDSSGFRSLIAQQSLGAEFVPFEDNLFNDRAVVMPAKHDGPYRPQTEALAMSAGWRWSIPLTTRIGNGYVYASKYISDDDAAAELRGALGNPDGEPRFLKMRVGRVRDSWTRNCLATGLAQGFIEPLEATALHIVIATALDFIQAMEAGEFTAQHRAQFNARTANRYEGIRDYIVAHYRLAQRDGQYWRDNAENQNLSGELKAVMTGWFTHGDMAKVTSDVYDQAYYSNASWHCLFAGYGTFPPAEKMRAAPVPSGDAQTVQAMLAACAKNFPPIGPVN